jgi:arylsulfatase
MVDAPTPNIVFITIDALRADHLSCQGYDREVSPTLDRFAETSAWFTQAWSTSSHTREAMPPLLSGRRPPTFGANGFQQVKRALAERLLEAGYRTAGFHSNPYVSRAYGFDAGFEEFNDDLILGQNRLLALFQRGIKKYLLKKGDHYAHAPEINQRSLEWVDTTTTTDEPFFLWNHYMDVHGPYNPPVTRYRDTRLSGDKAESLYNRSWKNPDSITDRERQLLYDGYDDSIRYLDAELGDFFDELKARGLYEDSLVIVTSDHGDAFGEHGYYTHPRQLHEMLLHVPLFISAPSQSVEQRNIPVSTLDVVPTILEFARGEYDESMHAPLVARDGSIVMARSEVVFASATGEEKSNKVRRFAVRDHRYKIIMERTIADGTVVSEVGFDLEVDPQERTPLEPTGDEFTELRERLYAHSSETPDSTVASSEDSRTNSEIEERLTALGYK